MLELKFVVLKPVIVRAEDESDPGGGMFSEYKSDGFQRNHADIC